MPTIRLLPPLVANQIAAGEVVERPASVVKELLDNALDAGGRRVVIELEQGGIELVRITDDGHGIPEAQLPLALAPHATSKIESAEDLERIGTLGFRGEALASVASVSRLAIRSRTAAMTGAAVIEAEGDTQRPPTPVSGPIGTQVTVRNLFFNTPARRKFLRTPNTEQGRCLDVIRELAMANPGVAIRLTSDGRVTMDLPMDQSPRERALQVMGPELAEQLIEVNGEDRGRAAPGRAGVPAGTGNGPVAFAALGEAAGPILLWGLVGLPNLARATTAAQHVFINGRPVRDRTIQHAVKEAYRGLIEPGRHPTVVLMIEMNPAEVDVNVHPAKAEVRFRESSRVHAIVLRTLRDALQGADLTPIIRTFTPPGGFGARGVLPSALPGEFASGGSTSGPESHAGASGRGGSGDRAFASGFLRPPRSESVERFSFEAMRSAAAASGVVRGEAPGMVSPEDIAAPALTRMPAAGRAYQVHNSFLVTQDEQGMVIIDQHALHERVMFEKLLSRIGARAGEPVARRLESQQLLAPMIVPASPAQVDRIESLRELFDRIGVEATPAGTASIAVSAFPTFLFERGVEPGPFLTELLDRAESSGFVPGSEEALHEVLDMMACKAAVKAGDRLTEGELSELLELRETVERSSNCPHGRPTSIRVTIAELERRFGRS